MFELTPGKTVASLYPLIPWVGVMMAGYAAGQIFTMEGRRRKRLLIRLGMAFTIAFVVLRASNLYGDPAPWAWQPQPLFTVMSFLRCTKYPPSLLYLLMTMGPTFIVLAWADGARGRLSKYLVTFGRVPLFYYLLHLPLIHVVAVLLSFASYGRASWLFRDFMNARSTVPPLPDGYGYDLPVVYGVWIAAVVALYPLCRWFSDVKRRRRSAILSYL